MHMVYDSESFVVVHMLTEHGVQHSVGDCATRPMAATSVPALPRHGFEIVDKRSGKEVYLDGAWAEIFHQEMRSWENDDTSQEDIEATLERYTQLAQNPVVLH